PRSRCACREAPSNVGSGTSSKIERIVSRLPLPPASQANRPVARRSESSMSQQPHILIADDERSIRLMLETGLTLNGFRVTSARTGREALEAVSAGRFDAVLSDVYMPDGNGLELVTSLRAVDPDIPIVLMTAQGSLQMAVEAVARGASDYIAKPFEI